MNATNNTTAVNTMNAVVNAVVSTIKVGTLVRLTTLTTPKMNKRGNPYFDRVQKLCVQTAQWGYSYENAVNNRLDKIGENADFVADKLSWGEWVIPNKVITHKGELYLRFYTTENANMQVLYLLDGRVATAEETKAILTFIPQRAESKRQSESGLTEHQVQPMSIKVENIVRVVGGGKTIEQTAKIDNLAKVGVAI